MDTPPHRSLVVTDDEYRSLCRALGREVVSGHDVAEYLKTPDDEEAFHDNGTAGISADKPVAVIRAKRK